MKHSESGLVVCYHNTNIPIIKNKSLRSILLNSSHHNPNSRNEFDFYDDDGDNISKYNSIYAELTALYYLWKNIEAPFYGLFHYRRFLDLSGLYKHPIQNLAFTDWDDITSTHELNIQRINNLVNEHKIILPYREKIYNDMTVEGHYREAHRSKDLDLLIEITDSINPQFGKQLKETLVGKTSYYCCVFIFAPEIFREFCEIIFPIFHELLPLIDFESEELQPGHLHSRVFGFMGERLVTAYIDYKCKKDPSLTPKHFSRTVFNFKRPYFSTSRKIHIKKNKPEVSVILPCYNVSEYLPHTFECLRAQTEESLEIIAVDDGSTDNTDEIINFYSQRDKRIRFIKQDNAGPGPARNLGIQESNGKYLHFYDPDDFITPNFYQVMTSNSRKYRSEIVMSCHWSVDPHIPAWDTSILKEAHLPSTLRHGKNPTNAHESPALFLAYTPVWDKLFKSEFLIKNNLLFPSIKTEDIPFSWMSYCLAEIVSICTQNNYFYRLRPGSETSTYKTFKEVFISVEVTEKWLSENNYLKKFSQYWSLKKFVSCAYGMYKIPDYLFQNPSDLFEYARNLTKIVESIPVDDINHFAANNIYKGWVGIFNHFRVGQTFNKIIEEIAKVSRYPIPNIQEKISASSIIDLDLSFENYNSKISLDCKLLVEKHKNIISKLQGITNNIDV